jgi:hypothetical protein
MRGWLLALLPVGLVVYFLLYPSQLVNLVAALKRALL